MWNNTEENITQFALLIYFLQIDFALVIAL